MKLKTLPFAVLLATSAAANAAVAINDNVTFSGFGTLAYTHSNNQEADFRTSYGQAEGAGKTNQETMDVDSKFGFQLQATGLDNKLTGTLQVVAKQAYDGSTKPTVQWANVKFAPNDDFYVRAGRVVAPVFMNSESRNVGYSQIRVRPPVDEFINPIDWLDGMDVGYGFDVGATRIKTQLALGYYNDKQAPLSADVIDEKTGKVLMAASPIKTQSHSALLNVTAENGNWTWRAGLGKSRVTTSSEYLSNYHGALAGLNAAGIDTGNLAKRADGSRVDVTTYGVGFSYDPGQWLVQGEFNGRQSDSLVVRSAQGLNLLAAYRLDNVTPYVGYSRIRSSNNADMTKGVGVGVPHPETGADLGEGIALLNHRLQTDLNQQIFTVGSRFDVAKNMDVKVQFDHVKKPAGSMGTFVNEDKTFTANKRSVNLFTVAVDYIF